MARKTDLLQGTLDLLILRTLAAGSMHGWGISQRIQQVTGEEHWPRMAGAVARVL